MTILTQLSDLALSPGVPRLVVYPSAWSAAPVPAPVSEVPEALLPPGERIALPSGEAFVEALDDTLKSREVSALYLLPPHLSPRELSSEFKDRYPNLSLEAASLLTAGARLKEGAEVLALVAPPFLASSRHERSRMHLLEVLAPTLLLTPERSNERRVLPMPPSFQMLGLSLLRGSAHRPLRFFKYPDDVAPGSVEEQEVIADFGKLLAQQGGETRFGYVVRERLPLSSPLIHDLYSPSHRSMREQVGRLGATRALGDVAEIRLGLVHAARDVAVLTDPDSDDGVPVLEGGCIQKDYRIDWDAARHRAKVPVERQLRVGDICVTFIAVGNLRACVVTEKDLPATCNHTVILIRPNVDGLEKEDARLLPSYLRSGLAADLLRAESPMMGVAWRVSVAALKQLPVPVFDSDLRHAVRDMETARVGLQGWADELLSAEQLLFDIAGPGASRAEVLGLARGARLRFRAASHVDSLSHRIRTLLPHPIAYRWRSVESSKPDIEGYDHVLECAEASLFFLAAIASIVARARGLQIGYLRQLATSVASGKGTNMGDWMAILREVNSSKAFRRAEDLPVPEIAVFMPQGDETDQAVQRLKQARDDRAHGRGPRGAAVAEQYEGCREDLKVFLAGIEFLAEYPLRLIETVAPDTFDECVRYTYRDLVGDHPLVPSERAMQPGLEHLEAGSLYVQDASKHLLLMRPLLTHRACPECGRLSTFFLDHIDRNGGLVVKSLEHGHTAVQPELLGPFQRIGWLHAK